MCSVIANHVPFSEEIIIKSVCFNGAVRVALIPCRSEYKSLQLDRDLWYSAADLKECMRREMAEIQQFMREQKQGLNRGVYANNIPVRSANTVSVPIQIKATSRSEPKKHVHMKEDTVPIQIKATSKSEPKIDMKEESEE